MISQNNIYDDINSGNPKSLTQNSVSSSYPTCENWSERSAIIGRQTEAISSMHTCDHVWMHVKKRNKSDREKRDSVYCTEFLIKRVEWESVVKFIVQFGFPLNVEMVFFFFRMFLFSVCLFVCVKLLISRKQMQQREWVVSSNTTSLYNHSWNSWAPALALACGSWKTRKIKKKKKKPRFYLYLSHVWSSEGATSVRDSWLQRQKDVFFPRCNYFFLLFCFDIFLLTSRNVHTSNWTAIRTLKSCESMCKIWKDKVFAGKNYFR